MGRTSVPKEAQRVIARWRFVLRDTREVDVLVYNHDAHGSAFPCAVVDAPGLTGRAHETTERRAVYKVAMALEPERVYRVSGGDEGAGS